MVYPAQSIHTILEATIQHQVRGGRDIVDDYCYADDHNGSSPPQQEVQDKGLTVLMHSGKEACGD